MSLEILKCPSCGANVEFNEGVESCECEYCGAKVTKTSAQNKNNSNASKTDFLSTSNTNKVNLKNVKSSVDKSMRKGIDLEQKNPADLPRDFYYNSTVCIAIPASVISIIP